MTSAAITQVFSEAIASAIPESSLTVSQWAETYRFVSAERSARPGKWSNALTPYFVEPMDTVGKPGIREIVVVASAQVGKTEFLNNVLGFLMHADPSSILFLAETEEKARAWSKESLAPTIRDTPVLAALIKDSRERDSGNTIEGKAFPGGHLALAWATSPATLSSRPRRAVLMDERDAFAPTREGDPAKLAEKRTTTYPDAIVLKVSTPRDRLEPGPGAAPDARRFTPIELEYENSDRRRYFVPCPHCGEYQPLVWARVKWDEDPLAAYYACVSGCVVEHEHKGEMLAKGEWRAENPGASRAGFHIWEGYSPFVTWGEMAQNFLEAKKSRATLKVFVNTSLAEGWEETGGQATVEDLTSRREPYGEFLPGEVLVLTAGVDVQGDRLEVEIVGWGLDEESWSLDYQVLDGDPARPDVWRELKELLTRGYEYEVPILGAGDEAANVLLMRVAAACVDSGGHHTDEVYRFCRQNAGRRYYAVKGASTAGKPLISKPTWQGKAPNQVKLYTVGTETAKDTLASRLAIADQGPGYCHFPTEFERAGRVFYGEQYFKQLRSEHAVVHHEKGVSVRRWEKVRKGARNEALDLRVYAMAALAILNPDFRALMRRREAAAREQAAAPPPVEDDADEAAPAAVRRVTPRRGQRGFVHGWR